MATVVTKDGALIQLTADDVGKYVRIVEPGNVMVQITEFSPALGSEIYIEHCSLNRVAFDKCTGALIRHLDMFYPEILGLYGVVTLVCIGPNEWNLFGALRPKPEWQLDIDSNVNLSYGLNPIVDEDWETQLTTLEATLETLQPPIDYELSCTITVPAS